MTQQHLWDGSALRGFSRRSLSQGTKETSCWRTVCLPPPPFLCLLHFFQGCGETISRNGFHGLPGHKLFLACDCSAQAKISANKHLRSTSWSNDLVYRSSLQQHLFKLLLLCNSLPQALVDTLIYLRKKQLFTLNLVRSCLSGKHAVMLLSFCHARVVQCCKREFVLAYISISPVCEHECWQIRCKLIWAGCTQILQTTLQRATWNSGLSLTYLGQIFLFRFLQI